VYGDEGDEEYHLLFWLLSDASELVLESGCQVCGWSVSDGGERELVAM